MSMDTFQVYLIELKQIENVRYVCFGSTYTEYYKFHIQNKVSVSAGHMSPVDSGQVPYICCICQYNLRLCARPANESLLKYLLDLV